MNSVTKIMELAKARNYRKWRLVVGFPARLVYIVSSRLAWEMSQQVWVLATHTISKSIIFKWIIFLNGGLFNALMHPLFLL